MKYVVGTLAALVGLGLILKFGGTSNTLLSTGASSVNNLAGTLLMNGSPGNTPIGVG